jgi:hypothetical protein
MKRLYLVLVLGLSACQQSDPGSQTVAAIDVPTTADAATFMRQMERDGAELFERAEFTRPVVGSCCQ